jgi:hypothetical protein
VALNAPIILGNFVPRDRTIAGCTLRVVRGDIFH